MRISFPNLALALAVIVMLAAPTKANAEIHLINQVSLTFDPPTLTITEGDIVRWRWKSGSHTVTNGTGAADPQVGTLFDEALTSANPIVEYQFTTAGTYPYFCRVHEAFNMNGTITVDVASGVETPPVTSATLRQNHPNPFSATTEIEYTIDARAPVTVSVFDTRGRHVVTLESADRAAGVHQVRWNGENARGNRVPAGVYYYRLQAGDLTRIKKLVLLK